LYKALLLAVDMIEREQAQDSGEIIAAMRDHILTSGAFDIEYIEIVDHDTLEPVARPADRRVLIALAARLGKARLIDNIIVGE